MRHQCKVTVIEKKCFEEYQREYLADPESGPCPCFEVGQEFLFRREGDYDDFWHFGRDLDPKFPCAEAWDAISRYIYTALQGGAIMHGWTNDDRLMIACCNDGTRPVIFKIERIDLPDLEAEESDEGNAGEMDADAGEADSDEKAADSGEMSSGESDAAAEKDADAGEADAADDARENEHMTGGE